MNYIEKLDRKLIKQEQADRQRREAAQADVQTEFLKSIEHLRLSVFEVRCGDMVQIVRLFKDGKYEPHLVDHEVISIYWNKGVTDFSGYYRKDEIQTF